jgi:hypothetical protein
MNTSMSPMTTSSEIAISCYENEVPAFVEVELDRLYGSLYSSLAHFRIFGGIENASTYVVRANRTVIAVLLFRHDRGKVRVINEGMKISEQEIARFVNYIFTVFRFVQVISFHAIQTDIQRLPFPYQRFNCTEDSVVMLPDSAQAYLASLGNATRKNIKRHKNRLQRSFPSFCYRVYTKGGVEEQHIRDIIGLNRARMARKNTISSIGDEEAQMITRLAQECGLVGVATIDGRVCAGTITYRLGEHYVSRVNAHDPAYDHYRLGMLCCYLTICQCIAAGGKEFHLMCGREEYKSLLLGVQQDLDHLAVYRSRAHFLLHGDMAFKTAFSAYILQAKLWLLRQAKHEHGVMSRPASGFVHFIRGVKRFGAGLAAGKRKGLP